MESTGKTWRRLVAMVASGALAMIGIVGAATAPAAMAAPINPNTNGSITVHALTMPTGGSVTATGMQTTPPSGATAIDGATFKLEKSTVDITTNAGYSSALSLTAASFGGKDTTFGTSGAMSGTTTTDGSYTFSSLKPGVYLLTQTAAPAGKTLMKPAVVFVPMTNPADTSSWVYDVHVYPKNSDAGKIVKTDITPAGTPISVGSTMTWQMDVPIPSLSSGDTFTSFKVQDLPTNLKATGVTSAVIDPAGTPVALVNTNDYTVAADQPAANQIEVTFTSAGLGKLNAAFGKILRLTVSTTVLDTVSENSPVKNEAKAIYKTTSGGDAETTIITDPNNPATTTFGKLKVMNTGGGENLAGGKFQIFQCSGTTTTGEALSVGGKNEFEITNAANGVTVSPLGATTAELCLVQTKAPDGYQMLAGPQKFGFAKETVSAASDKTVTVTVNNNATSGITGLLPNTGGAGIAIFVIVGLALIGAGVGYMRYHRQRS